MPEMAGDGFSSFPFIVGGLFSSSFRVSHLFASLSLSNSWRSVFVTVFTKGVSVSATKFRLGDICFRKKYTC